MCALPHNLAALFTHNLAGALEVVKDVVRTPVTAEHHSGTA